VIDGKETHSQDSITILKAAQQNQAVGVLALDAGQATLAPHASAGVTVK